MSDTISIKSGGSDKEETEPEESGELTFEEEICKVFKSMDSDKSGLLNLNQFTELCEHFKVSNSKYQIADMFHQKDTNRKKAL
eukprot:UN23120